MAVAARRGARPDLPGQAALAALPHRRRRAGHQLPVRDRRLHDHLRELSAIRRTPPVVGAVAPGSAAAARGLPAGRPDRRRSTAARSTRFDGPRRPMSRSGPDEAMRFDSRARRRRRRRSRDHRAPIRRARPLRQRGPRRPARRRPERRARVRAGCRCCELPGAALRHDRRYRRDDGRRRSAR